MLKIHYSGKNVNRMMTAILQRIGSVRWLLVFSLLALGITGCAPQTDSQAPGTMNSALEEMAATWGADLKFDQDFLKAFGERNHVKTQFVPNTRLEVYRELMRKHSGKPDLLELDIIWPSILADDLLDLRPYVKDTVGQFPEQLLANYTVRGRLVALPFSVDMGVMFYRPELLEKYGFKKPPQTWEELEMMAGRIQAGERRAGNKNFWGYVWQGSTTEGGTCNALEWQSSAGAGNFIEESGKVNVRSSRFAEALRRSTSWIGTISPPAEFVYNEDDSVNIWDAGQTAFMRNWATAYGHLKKQPGSDKRHFGVALLPAGPGGHRGTLGGLGLAISKYAANQTLAIKALLEITSEQNDLARLAATGAIPTHTSAFLRPDVKAQSVLLAISGELVNAVVARPALVTGDKYVQVSTEYAQAVNLVLRRKASAEAAMAELDRKLVKIMGTAGPN